MELEGEAKKLVGHIKRLKFSGEFQIKLKGPPSEGPADEHIGAVIVDATLSARHNYKTQVEPIVTNLRNKYPKGKTTSGFLCLIHSIGPEKLVDGWEKDSAEKLRQIQVVETAQFFADHDIETFSDLAAWIKQESNRQELKKEVYGIGNKIADYYGVLTGDPDAVAIDVCISIFLSNAGIDTNNYSYKEKKTIVQLAARQMGYRPLDLEQSIWGYNPKRKQKGEKMDKNNKDSILGVHLPPQKMEQLETIAREEYDEQPENLAKFWIIERLHQLFGDQDLTGRTPQGTPEMPSTEKPKSSEQLDTERSVQSIKKQLAERYIKSLHIEDPEAEKCLFLKTDDKEIHDWGCYIAGLVLTERGQATFERKDILKILHDQLIPTDIYNKKYVQASRVLPADVCPNSPASTAKCRFPSLEAIDRSRRPYTYRFLGFKEAIGRKFGPDTLEAMLSDC